MIADCVGPEVNAGHPSATIVRETATDLSNEGIARMINNPHALYCNGELVGIITNPDPLTDFAEFVESMGNGDAVTIPQNMGNLEQWGAFARAVQGLEVAETIEPTNKERKIVIHVVENDDRFYEINEVDVIEAGEIPVEEGKRMGWLRDRWHPTRVHSDTEVDIVIVPDDYEGWEEFDKYVNELPSI